MYSIKRGFIYLTVLIVILSITVPEVEGRRLVLRGRRTITRHYYSGSTLPWWLNIVLIALAQILVGVVLFFVLRRLVLTKSEETMNTYQPAPLEDISNN
ncbi:uncharacterized protein LOC129573571 [Sitodiplosis mosellana]|uniref:uncharacterized protein LOC129573571 n=1 Tax=Sitodiplosis mosellana TaxID=263140 RepID=UPI002444E9DD|nr:uncharacterized protein LOC129573571 [Sitodiplosis mosellana]